MAGCHSGLLQQGRHQSMSPTQADFDCGAGAHETQRHLRHCVVSRPNPSVAFPRGAEFSFSSAFVKETSGGE